MKNTNTTLKALALILTALTLIGVLVACNKSNQDSISPPIEPKATKAVTTSENQPYIVTIIYNNDMNMQHSVASGNVYTTPLTAGSKTCTFAPTNYELVGWSATETNEFGITENTKFYAPGETIYLYGNITLTAIWKLK